MTDVEQKKLRGTYRYVFGTSQGREVIKDLKVLGAYDEPMTSSPAPSDRDLLVRAVWRDVIDTIEKMTKEIVNE